MSEQKKMVYLLIRNVVIMLLLVLVVGLFIVSHKLAFTLGIILGGFVTIIKIFMMQETMEKAMTKEPYAATNYVRAQYFLRYIITFLVLFIGVYTSYVDFIGLAIGLLALKPAAYLQGKLEPPVAKDGSVEFLEWEEEDEDEKSDFW
jgi:hypothetical protein